MYTRVIRYIKNNDLMIYGNNYIFRLIKAGEVRSNSISYYESYIQMWYKEWYSEINQDLTSKYKSKIKVLDLKLKNLI